MKTTSLVSIHGGHSGQFCLHATDSLEEIVKRYIEKKYSWIGITEHSPPISEKILYPDQLKAMLTPESILESFAGYMVECRRLQKKYASSITIFAAIEIETYSGYEHFVPSLIKRFRPDYIVGSVHFVDDIGFDYSQSQYYKISEAVGGIDNLYCKYFDQQYEMIKLLEPAVVGHFDLIRIHDPHYKERLQKPAIMARIKRNLSLIKELNLIMDFNLRAIHKGNDEPYISRQILKLARELNIAVVPGDDSHGLTSVGNYMDRGLSILEEEGFSAIWQRPKLYSYTTIDGSQIK